MDRMFFIKFWIITIYHTAIIKCSRHICNEQGLCQNQEITCLQNQSCIIECTRNWACANTIIQCPINHECNINCYYPQQSDDISENGNRICHNMFINATYSSSLTVNATLGNIHHLLPYPRTMESSQIYCPHNGVNHHNEDKPCQIYCDGDDLMRFIKIYAIEGMNDISVTTINYQRDWCMRNANLFCVSGYIKNCSLSNYAPYQCADSPNIPNDQFCETYKLTTNSPTMNPTTLSPTEETKIPTISETLTTISDSDDGAIIGVGIEDKGVLPQSGLIALIVFCSIICVIIMIFISAHVMRQRRKDTSGKHKKMETCDMDQEEEDGDGNNKENETENDNEIEADGDNEKLLSPTKEVGTKDIEDVLSEQSEEQIFEIGYDGEDKILNKPEIDGKDR